MELDKRIAETCKKVYDRKGSLLPPQVCPFCFGCPIATIVVGISGNVQQRAARNIPADRQAEVVAWLDKLEAKS